MNRDAGYRSTDNTKRTVPVETFDALVVQDNALIIQDRLVYDWSYVAQDEPTEFALMAYTLNFPGSDTEVQSCFKNCVKTYEKLQKQFDKQRQTLNKANIEIVAYQLGLEYVEAQLIVHQKNEVVYEEKIVALEFEVKDKSNAITRLKRVTQVEIKRRSVILTTEIFEFRMGCFKSLAAENVVRAVGIDMKKVKFIWSSDEIDSRPREYWETVMDFSRGNSLPAVMGCCQMGQSEQD
ncbi:ribonuclease H-like domain-containing protein [Tanacetum coccineum]